MATGPAHAGVGEAPAPAALEGSLGSPARTIRGCSSRRKDLVLPGVQELWAETLGNPEVCVAVLDGPVDLAHPSLAGANLVQLQTLVPGCAGSRPACAHGTHIASVIFGQHDSPVKGLAPHCRGLAVPIFASAADGSYRPCTQIDLACALAQAVQQGAHIINISGGEFSPSGDAHPLLARVVQACAQQGILIVAAAGNQGCDCLHIPAALPAVLAVGAMDARGQPLASSNWGGPYQAQGLLAPGTDIVGAQPGGGTVPRTGTSFATAVVSGVAALLLSLLWQRGRKGSVEVVREALLRTARGCAQQPIAECRRLLAGRLNVQGAKRFLIQGRLTMSEALETQDRDVIPPSDLLRPSEVEVRAPSGTGGSPVPRLADQREPDTVAPSECACQKTAAAPQLVYALGQLGYDFISEARLDSLVQKMASRTGASAAERLLAFDPHQLLAYFEVNPWDAAAIEWTLRVDGTPLYAIRPRGPFAVHAYQELRNFLRQQLVEGVERISVPGVRAGKATLLLGQVVPVIVPEIRGMYSWTTAALVEAVVGADPALEETGSEKERREQKKAGIRNFLNRVYHELRNLGLTPQERALNFAATNSFEIERIYESALKEEMELDTIRVTRSALCRPGSDCWEVELYFFFPDRQVQTVRKVYRFTVDVSDVVPVTVGPMRSWFTR